MNGAFGASGASALSSVWTVGRSGCKTPQKAGAGSEALLSYHGPCSLGSSRDPEPVLQQEVIEEGVQ